MKIMRHTIFIGLVCGLLFVPITGGLTYFVGYQMSFRLAIWLFIAIYGYFLAGWGKVGKITLIFPVFMLLLFSLWGGSLNVFLIFSLVTLAWIRSGVCFPTGLFRMFFAEMMICFGAGLLVYVFAPHSAMSWALGIWMFFLIQSLYFPLFAKSDEEQTETDPFEKARKGAEEILRS